MTPALPVYATPANLTGEPWNVQLTPESATALLRYAGILVRSATKTAVYEVDEVTGLPTDATLADALRDATCQQVVSWLAVGIDPEKGAAQDVAVVAGKSLGPASIQYADAADAAIARARAARGLSFEAGMYLSTAGLLGGAPQVYG